VPALALVALVFLSKTISEISARQLMWCYLFAAALMYSRVVLLRYGGDLLRSLSSRRQSGMAASEVAAANRLGAVVLAQQALGWSAVAIVPGFYGDASYSAFVVSQKLATLISLLMLAINFTFSSRFAALHAQERLAELWNLVRLSVVAIALASLFILAGTWLFIGEILDYAHVPLDYGNVVIIMMIGQIGFSIAALFALVLSMCRMEVFLLRAQLTIGMLSIAALLIVCIYSSLNAAVLVFPVSYFALAWILCARIRTLIHEQRATR